MMFKQTSKKSIEKISQKPKKKTEKNEKTKKSTKSVKKVAKKSIVPRTCRDSPIEFYYPKHTIRMASLDLGKPKKSDKKLKRKTPIKRFRKSSSKPFSKLEEKVEKLISPIKKVKLQFLNPDETSLISVLEILHSN